MNRLPSTPVVLAHQRVGTLGALPGREWLKTGLPCRRLVARRKVALHDGHRANNQRNAGRDAMKDTSSRLVLVTVQRPVVMLLYTGTEWP